MIPYSCLNTVCVSYFEFFLEKNVSKIMRPKGVKYSSDCTREHLKPQSFQGPLKGPGSSGVLDALWCNLGAFWALF